LLSGRRKLLLADDSPTIQKVISLTFGDEGVEVVAVGDGESALRALAEDPPPDVILADVVMPGPDGYELCERVKSDRRLRHVPVVLLVGTFEPFNEAEARRVGADTVLTKPFSSIRGLVSKVGSLFGGGETPQEDEGSRAPDEREQRGAATPAATPPAAEHAPGGAPVGAAFGADAGDADESDSFADLGADDELIEARPADAFGGGAAAGAAGFPTRAEAPRAYVETHEPEFNAPPRDAEGGDDAPAPFGAGGAEVFARRRHDRERSQFEEVLTERAEEGAMHETDTHQPQFDAYETRAAGAAATDDALLDLGQVDAPHAPAPAAEHDDFILDLDLEDEPPARHAAHAGEVLGEPAFEAVPAARARADAPSAFAEAAHGERPRQFAGATAAEVLTPSDELLGDDLFEAFDEHPRPAEAHASAEAADEPWRDVVMQDGPQGFAFGAEAEAPAAAPRGFIEPEVVPADEPVPAVVEGEFTDGSVEGDRPKPPARETAAAAAPQEPSAASYAVGRARAGLDEAPRAESPRADQLSPEQVDAIARRVVELMSDKAVREIAWEVVPELAELIIRQRLDEQKQ
jgi:CheY-like chemotaxis protein